MSPTTKHCRALVCLSLAAAFACATSAGAQTLGELADSQRAKQQAELLKTQKELADAEAAAAAKVASTTAPKLSTEDARQAARRSELAARPKIVLHSLYSRNGTWVAELASGQGLALALVGMQIYGNRIASIDQRGIVLTKACTAEDVREKARCGQRVLVLGEAI